MEGKEGKLRIVGVVSAVSLVGEVMGGEVD